MHLITHTLKTSKNTLKKASIPSRSWLDRTVSPKTPGHCNPFDLYFGVSTLQSKALFKQQQGSSGFQVHQPLLSKYQLSLTSHSWWFWAAMSICTYINYVQVAQQAEGPRYLWSVAEWSFLPVSPWQKSQVWVFFPMISMARITWKTHNCNYM